jgi:hypothetical protein
MILIQTGFASEQVSVVIVRLSDAARLNLNVRYWYSSAGKV